MPDKVTPPHVRKLLNREFTRHIDRDSPCSGCDGYQRLAELVWYLQHHPGAEPQLLARELAATAELIDDGAHHLLSTTRILAELHWRLASGVRSQ